MRMRDHVIASTVAAALLYPRSPTRAAALLLGGVAIDTDHFLMYTLTTGDWTLSGALNYDRYRHFRAAAGDTRPRYGPMRSGLHNPLWLLPLWWLARRHPHLRAVAWGLSLHLLMDYWTTPIEWAIRLRAGGRCACCGQRRRLRVYAMFENGQYRLTPVCRSCIAAYEGAAHPVSVVD